VSIDRHQALHRQRRIIFNDDAGYLHRETSSTPEGIRSVEFAVFTLYTDVPIEPNLEVGENSVEVSLRPRASGLTGPVDIVGLELFISYQ